MDRMLLPYLPVVTGAKPDREMGKDNDAEPPHGVPKSVAHALSANKPTMAITKWLMFSFTYIVQKTDKTSPVFRYAQGPTRKKATCRRQSCCVPLPASALFLKHVNRQSPYSDRLRHYPQSLPWYPHPAQTAFLYKLIKLKIPLKSTNKTKQKNKPFVVHIVMKKVVHSESPSIVLEC
jgi:hypothetical protein